MRTRRSRSEKARSARSPGTVRASLACLLLATAALVACASPAPERRDVVVGIVGEPASVFAEDPFARLVAAAVTEQLVRRDARGDLVPRLAMTVPTLENGAARVEHDATAPDGRLVADFRLRSGLRWQDGEPITAADVFFAFAQERLAPAGSEARWIADHVERVEVTGERDVRFAYRAGERWADYPLAARVLPRHVLAAADAGARAKFAREPVHAGPFAVAAWIPGFGVTLSAFKDHVLGPPALGRIEIRFLSDRRAVLDALRHGEIDVAPSPALEADLSRTLDRIADGTERTGLQAYYTPSEALDVLRFGGSRFADARARRAVELTIDRQGIVDDVFAGRARIPASYLVPPLWAAAENTPPARPDRDAARALLAAAGFARGNFGILERGGERMTVALLVASGSVGRTDAARRVAGDLAAVGIAAEVRERPIADVLGLVARGEFDLALMPQRADDPDVATEVYRGLAGPWFDALAAAVRSTADRGEKRSLYAEMQRVWSSELPALPLYQHLQVDVAPRALTGVQPSPAGDALTWSARDWRFAAP